MFSHVLSFRPFGFQARPWLNFPHIVTSSPVYDFFGLTHIQQLHMNMDYKNTSQLLTKALSLEFIFSVALFCMQRTIPKVKESRSRCNFFSEMNKIEVAFEKKKRKRKETVKTLGSMWESQKMFTSFHLHENFRLILRIWEKKWYEIILSLPKNAQMPHQIEYWKFQHILAQVVIKLNLSGALFYFFFTRNIRRSLTQKKIQRTWFLCVRFRD